jgi:hypothetical protein
MIIIGCSHWRISYKVSLIKAKVSMGEIGVWYCDMEIVLGVARYMYYTKVCLPKHGPSAMTVYAGILPSAKGAVIAMVS